MQFNQTRYMSWLLLIFLTSVHFHPRTTELKLKKDITLKESLIGFSFDIKHLNGKKYTINNDKGNIIPTNYCKEIEGLGMSRDDNIGKLVIDFNIIFPEKLTDEQIEKIKEIL